MILLLYTPQNNVFILNEVQDQGCTKCPWLKSGGSFINIGGRGRLWERVPRTPPPPTAHTHTCIVFLFCMFVCLAGCLLCHNFDEGGGWLRGHVFPSLQLAYSLKKKITLYSLYFHSLGSDVSDHFFSGVSIEWTGRDFTRWVVNFHSTGVRIPSEIHSTSEISSLHIDGVNYSLDLF